MAIVIDGRMFGSSGIGTYLRSLLPRLTQLGAAYRFRILANSKLGKRALDFGPNAEFENFEAKLFSPSEQIALTKRSRKAQLFWSPHIAIPLLYQGKLVVTVHDVFHLAMSRGMTTLHKRLCTQLFLNAIKLKSHAVLCDSRFTAEEMMRLAGYQSNQIHVVYPGVELQWFNVMRTSRPHPRPYVLFVGNVTPHKNLVRLISAFDSIAHSVPHDLVIVGRRDGFRAVDQVAQRTADRLGNRVVFTGYVDDDSLRQYVANADALALPSLYEGFGLPALEAMACGCPVIASRAAAIPEVCGDAAIYCDPYDPLDIGKKIAFVLSSETLRSELKEKGQKHARSFSWDKSAQETWGVMAHVLQ